MYSKLFVDNSKAKDKSKNRELSISCYETLRNSYKAISMIQKLEEEGKIDSELREIILNEINENISATTKRFTEDVNRHGR